MTIKPINIMNGPSPRIIVIVRYTKKRVEINSRLIQPQVPTASRTCWTFLATHAPIPAVPELVLLAVGCLGLRRIKTRERGRIWREREREGGDKKRRLHESGFRITISG